ncbi:TIGR03905 family TSCPD domain-containing protein [Clostridium sp.]|uniref:TIGR03905 family TSCPD domain-containing protein n=1 Tax=Clostridium sp. TaxID=1506 RepID=UPI002A90B92C|nr:TIGR03905 family TSCPD domain-containing protein [Clostridium sp.]MDY6011516.1 TIGR03905 family TSCPD domain-containing protein [Clostridium sp.]
MYVYKTSGVCSTEIHVEMENDTIKSVEFVRGCPGNLFGISSLVKGMNIDEAISKLEGIKCRDKATSCPDQLAQALKEIKNK